MTKSKHTPGPWGCCDTSYHAHDYRLTKPNGFPLPLNVVANDHSEQRANARLIAAAPDMYEVLDLVAHEELPFSANPIEVITRWRERARAILARIEGE